MANESIHTCKLFISVTHLAQLFHPSLLQLLQTTLAHQRQHRYILTCTDIMFTPHTDMNMHTQLAQLAGMTRESMKNVYGIIVLLRLPAMLGLSGLAFCERNSSKDQKFTALPTEELELSELEFAPLQLDQQNPAVGLGTAAESGSDSDTVAVSVDTQRTRTATDEDEIIPTLEATTAVGSLTAGESVLVGNAGRCAVFMICSFLFVFAGCEGGYQNYIDTYALRHLRTSAVTASTLNSAHNGSFAAGRLLGILSSLFLKPGTMVTVDMITCLSAIGLILSFPHSAPVCFAGSILYGVGVATIYPSAVTFTEQNAVKVSGGVLSLLVSTACLGEAILPQLIGLAMDSKLGMVPAHMMVILGTMCSAAFGVFLGLLCFVRTHRTRKLTDPNGK